MSIGSKIICLIACHAGPAEHFAAFAETFAQNGYEVRVCASGPSLQKLQEKKIDVWPFNAEESPLNQVIERCEGAGLVITDVGHVFDIEIQKALQGRAVAYYDNPEPYVPGGYSETAAKVMQEAGKVLFANANLVEAPLFYQKGKEVKLPPEKRIGLGYYPLAKAKELLEKRTIGQMEKRKEFFENHQIADLGQKIVTYFGGNNSDYFIKAFPAFLQFLGEGVKQTDLSHYVIVLQQHPGAKSQNIDRCALEQWVKEFGDNSHAPKIVISDISSDEIQLFTDGAMYFQTSMGPQFALIGIPTIQVGHERYEDILVREGVCPSVTSSPALIEALQSLAPSSSPTLYKSLGIDRNWQTTLLESI